MVVNRFEFIKQINKPCVISFLDWLACVYYGAAFVTTEYLRTCGIPSEVCATTNYLCKSHEDLCRESPWRGQVFWLSLFWLILMWLGMAIYEVQQYRFIVRPSEDDWHTENTWSLEKFTRYVSYDGWNSLETDSFLG